MSRAKVLTLDDAIAKVLSAEDRSKASCAAVWLEVLRSRESEAVARASDWSAGVQAQYELYCLAKADHEARKVAIATSTALPVQPFRDELARRNSDMTTTKAAKKARGESNGRRGRSVDFYVGGNKITRRYFLGFMANEHTKRILRNERMSTEEFRALLDELGVAEPEHTTWNFELPNGAVVGAALSGKTLPAAKKVTLAQAKKVAIDKVTAVTDTVRAPRLATPKKAAAKKAPAKKKVTKQARVRGGAAAPKKSTAKKAGAASKPLSKPMLPRKAAAVAKRKSAKRVTKRAR